MQLCLCCDVLHAYASGLTWPLVRTVKSLDYGIIVLCIVKSASAKHVLWLFIIMLLKSVLHNRLPYHKNKINCYQTKDSFISHCSSQHTNIAYLPTYRISLFSRIPVHETSIKIHLVIQQSHILNRRKFYCDYW